jgi:hypothetical protein
MQSQAYFSGIREVIASHLSSARDSVFVCVNVLTDRDLFELLVSCQRRGARVSLVLVDKLGNSQSSISWERLSALGGRIFWRPEPPSNEPEPAPQFCLIDHKLVISGSFNWTAQVPSVVQEAILVQSDHEFVAYFENVFEDLSGEPGAASKVSSEMPQVSVDLLLPGQGLGVDLYQNTQIEKWRLQARVMQARIVSVEAEIADIQRQMHLFDHQQEATIGDLIRRYLDLKRRYLHHTYRESREDQHRQNAEAAEKAYQQYEQARDAKAQVPPPEALDPLQQQELKLLYRKLAMQCHPDRVSDAEKVNAKAFFQQLQASYLNNDLVNLHLLKRQIEQGLSASVRADAPDEAQQLKAHLKALDQTMAKLTEQLAKLSQGAAWRTISNPADWAAWFAQQAEQLQMEMQRYMAKLDRAEQDTKTCSP